MNFKYPTIEFNKEDPDFFKVLDQRLLPFEVKYEVVDTYEKAFFAIKEMVVRGAPLIGVTASFGVYIGLVQLKKANSDAEEIFDIADFLKSSRPTAVNLFYAIDKQLEALKGLTDIDKMISISLEVALDLYNYEIDCSKKIGEAGCKLIKAISEKKNGETVNILTHCNAGYLATVEYGTATAPIYYAHEQGIKIHVWVDETRPRNQGAKLTAWELNQHGVPHTVIPDNAGGHLMQHEMVDMCIVGSDRTTITGDVANKIGTYLKALAAHDNNIPFYAALPISTIDKTLTDGVAQIPIEKRDTEEVDYYEGDTDQGVKKVRMTSPGSKSVNYGFDVTPSRLITGLITEKGVCSVENIAKTIEG